MMEEIELTGVEGQLRNVVWSLMCCHGYNPDDHVFWGIASGKPLGDKAWELLQDMHKQPTFQIPKSLVEWAKEQDTKS